MRGEQATTTSEVSKMKYLEGALEQGGLKVEVEAVTTDE